MNEQDQNRACAELDGNWIITHGFGNMVHFKNYNTYDAIIPLIQKSFDAHEYRIKFQPVLSDITFTKSQINHAKEYFCATPSQLREALLRATGKWKD